MNKYIIILFSILLSCDNHSSVKNEVARTFSTDSLKTFVYNDGDLIEVNIEKIETDIIADSIFYPDAHFVRLETNPECLIGHIDNVYFSNDLIFVVDKRITKSVFIYSIDGNFKSKIDNRGKGPGEYIDIQDVDINHITKQIAVLDGYSRKVNFYNFKGEFIESKDTAPLILYALASIDSINYIFDKGRYPDNNLISDVGQYRIICSDLKAIFHKGITIEKSAMNLHHNTQRQFWKFGEDIFFNKPFQDTIYRVSKDSIVAAYYLNLNGHNIPYKDKMDLTDNKVKDLTGKYAFLNGDFIEFEDFTYFEIFYPGSTQHVFYSKESGKVISGRDFVIFNPLLNFVGTPISRYKNNIFVVTVDACFLKNLSWDSCPVKDQYPYLKSKFDSLVNGLTCEDNPTLMFYSLKKF